MTGLVAKVQGFHQEGCDLELLKEEVVTGLDLCVRIHPPCCRHSHLCCVLVCEEIVSKYILLNVEVLPCDSCF